MKTDTDRISEKIAALLRLAERAGSEGERDAALAQASRLCTKHNIELQSVERGDDDGCVERHLANYGREPLWMGPVCRILEDHFFVAVYHQLHAHRPSRLMLVGAGHNCEIAIYVYVFLQRRFREAWEAFADQRGTRTGERSYYAGVWAALDERLRRERATQHTAAEQQALIRVGHDAQAALHARHADLTVQQSRPSAHRDVLAFLQGCEDGAAIEIRPALKAAADTAALTSDL